jgi:putative aldouronate transport system permease protein
VTAPRSAGEKAFEAVNYAFFFLIALVMIYPLWYVLMYSFSAEADYQSLYLLPKGLSFQPYVEVFKDGRVFHSLRNSLFIVTAGTAISMVLTIFAAFPLSRSSMWGRKYITAFIVFTMLFDGGLIPTYLVVRSYGLVNTLWSLFLPQAVIVYNLLIMTRFFANMPASLIESAHMDGANDITVLFRLVLPLSKAVLSAVGLFYAVFIWNGYLPGLIYIQDAAKLPVQTMLYLIVKSADTMQSSGTSRGLVLEAFKMAAAAITVLPILLVYPFLQKHFVKGVLLGSIKG